MALSTEMLLTRTGLRTASEYQIAIFRHVEQALDAYTNRKPVTNAVVQAVAGSGKTTTIVAASALIPNNLKAIFLAFNKDIQLELDARLGRNVQAKTLNALGWGICKRYADGIAGRHLSFDEFGDNGKIWGIIRNTYDKKDRDAYGKQVKSLVDKARGYGIVPENLEGKVEINGQTYWHESANGLTDTDETWAMLIRTFGIDISPDQRPTVIRMVREVLTADLLDETCTDFDDQKYFPVVKRTEDGGYLPHFEFDVVIVDEDQDLSPVDRALVKLVLKKGGVFFGVGDSRQAIYGFRGADIHSVEKLKEEFSAIELPLSISYRCAKSIVEHARSIYPIIEAAPNAPEGEVTELGNYTSEEFVARDEPMVVCRNNAPIVEFAYKLIRRRIPVFVKGRDIGKGLLALIDNLKAKSVRQLAANLKVWQASQVAIIEDEDPNNEDAIQRINDKYATLMVFIKENSDDSVQSVITEIENLFTTKGNDKGDKQAMRGKVVLSTIHKAKGLEADTVFFLDSFLMHPRWIEPGTWQEIQEKNLEYVAVTRAKNRLVYITNKGFKD